jgi:CRISPR-associated protein Cmr3
MSKTVHCLIEPRDPLIFRDGRPFAAGITPHSMSWPHPTVIIGTARTRIGLPGPFNAALVDRLLQVRQRGPLLAYTEAASWKLAVPAPHDAAIFPAKNGDAQNFELYPCRPTLLQQAEGTDLDIGATTSGLWPTLADLPNVKPPTDVPSWWSWKQYKRWLLHDGSDSIAVPRSELGLHGPLRQTRVHISINPETSTAAEGRLFATEGLEFARTHKRGDTPEPLALYSEFTVPEGMAHDKLQGVISIGGERRLARWHAAENLLSELQPPEELFDRILQTRRLRLILITPGSFEKGWVPRWLADSSPPPVNQSAIRFELKGAAVGRFIPISGWDLLNGEPKPTRFLAPSGSVYFLTLTGEPKTRESTADELRSLWLQPISDSEADRRDGFGVCVLGTWGQ